MAKSTSPARKGKLKLFKTVIGFHDAYVAAPSQKAALQAWGASTDLFSAKLAEKIDDPAVCQAAFDKPGAILTARRGSGKEWAERSRPKPNTPSKVDTARAAVEKRMAALERRHAEGLAAIDLKIDSLREKRDSMERTFAAKRDKLRAELDAI